MNFLKGKRTYLIGFLMVIVGGLFQQGFISDTLFKTLEGVLTGGGLMALRAGVADAKK